MVLLKNSIKDLRKNYNFYIAYSIKHEGIEYCLIQFIDTLTLKLKLRKA